MTLADHTPRTAHSVQHSTDLSQACDLFLDELRDWADQCVIEFSELPPTDGHDQGTFTTAWEPLVRRRRSENEHLLVFMRSYRDSIRRHFTEQGAWKHGYWSMQEAHHGTEHFELFLGSLHRLDPADSETTRQLIDAAEHLGNWAPDVPDWFDWESGLFRSMFFGAEGIRHDDPALTLNVPDHFRCVNISLIAHHMTAQRRYLELAIRHASQWADAINAGLDIPVAIDRLEGPLYRLPEAGEKGYKAFAGQAPAELNDAVDRTENLLASGAINAFLTIWDRTGSERFRRAAERLLDVLATQLFDPDAGAAADAIRAYRRLTGDQRFDNEILNCVDRCRPHQIAEVSIDPAPPRAGRPSGIGKRGDMPNWFEDGEPRRCNPILLAVAAEIRRDELLATSAADIARTYFQIARAVYPHGRQHGCSARTVSAIARGHGRENNSGVTTAVLGPLLDIMKS